MYRFLSYLWPIKVKEVRSPINGILDITWENGALVLNSEHANYSYGKLHFVMKKVLNHYKNEIRVAKKILLIGYGGGSAAKILRKWNHQASITAVEIDPVIVDISLEYFPQKNIEIICEDAFIFLEKRTNTFDLIISDLFIDDTVVGTSFTDHYYHLIINHLNKNGLFIQNAMPKSAGWEEQASLRFKRFFRTVNIFKPLEGNTVWAGYG